MSRSSISNPILNRAFILEDCLTQIVTFIDNARSGSVHGLLQLEDTPLMLELEGALHDIISFDDEVELIRNFKKCLML